MSVALTAERSDIAEEAPIVFRISKDLIFSDDARLDFQAQVWCGQADVGRNADALRAFHARIACGDITDEVSVTFGVRQSDLSEPVHGGKCTLTLSVTPSSRILVSVQLALLLPGRNPRDLLDTCAVYFETDPICVENFFRQLDRSLHAPLLASLHGFDVGLTPQ